MLSDAEHWDDVAEKYVEITESPESKSFQVRKSVLYPCLLKTIGDISGKTVLDYGCGSGGLCKMLHGMGAYTFGCDISEKFVQLARKNAKDTEYLHFTGKAPYPDGKFDLVISNFVLFTTKEHQIIADDMFRVTKQGGRNIIILLHPTHYRADEINLKLEEEILPDKLGGVVPFTYHRRSVEAYKKLFEKAGFQIEETVECIYTGENQSFQKYKDNPMFLIYKLQKTQI